MDLAKRGGRLICGMLYRVLQHNLLRAFLRQFFLIGQVVFFTPEAYNWRPRSCAAAS